MKIIKEKEELESRVEFNKRIYSKEVIEYYKSLLNLEVSSLNGNEIPEDILNELKNTSIYNDLARFNIYKHAFDLLGNDSNVKKLYTGREDLGYIIPSHIQDYKVFSYNPYKDEVTLYDLTIDRKYREKKIDKIKLDRIEVINKQIDLITKKLENSKDSFDLKVERDQLEQTKEIANLEIKSLNDRTKHEDYAAEIRDTLENYNETFNNFYNIDKKIKSLKIGNTKLTNYTYHY